MLIEMPETPEVPSVYVTPGVVLSPPNEESPSNEVKRPSLARRRHTEPPPRLLYQEHGRVTSSEWIDEEDSPRRQHRSKRRSAQEHSRNLPREEQEPATSSEWIDEDASPRRKYRSKRRSARDQSGKRVRRSRVHDEWNPGSKKPIISRVGGSQRREWRREQSPDKLNASRSSESPSVQDHDRHSELPRSSPSSIRAVERGSHRFSTNFSGTDEVNESSRLGQSDCSSGSSTLTQQSYDRQSASLPNVFDYLDPPAVEDVDDHRSVTSWSSSNYVPSDAGWSEGPGTPSSRSSFPSPTSTKGQISPELRRKQTWSPLTLTSPVRSESNSPDFDIRAYKSPRRVCDTIEEEEYDSSNDAVASPLESRRYAPDIVETGSDRLKSQEESLHQHMAYTQQRHFVEPAYGQHRSPSTGFSYSDKPSRPFLGATRQHSWIPDTKTPTPSTTSNIPTDDEQTKPRTPKPTTTGYEQLALELTNPSSSVKPLYRKFAYLNHRILLYLQDELSELEEQLRSLDQLIAQIDLASNNGVPTPASRRNETRSGNALHLRRRDLLGQIFFKIEQYNRAVKGYAATAGALGSAREEEVARYREWMTEHAPVHSVETRFLDRGEDLGFPGGETALENVSTKVLTMEFVSVALILLLFYGIPSQTVRVAVTAVFAVGLPVLARMAKTRKAMLGPGWAIGGAVHVLSMGLIPAYVP